MGLAPGTSIGRYDVASLLGEGGMGQVWQATDTQLNRQVALKILSDAFSEDPDRLARFTREAQIPLDEALSIAKQIAEALEAAHEQGVIHRDLKPANIKVREDGTVKVLDFGLAKALAPEPEGDPSQSPTLTAAGATQMGVIMGTAAYMSPEQARGKVVDRRADIWAFGAVMFEMLSGTRAFAGDDVSLTLSAVLQREPEWTRLSPDVPPGLTAYLHRCLQKDPTQRVQAIGDVRLALTGAFESCVIDAAVAPHQSGWPGRPLLALAMLVGVVGSGLAVWSAMRSEPPRVVRFVLLPDDAGPLHVCELPGALRGASWAENGAIVFGSGDPESGLWRVAAAGGQPEQLTQADAEQGEFDHVWPEFLPGGEAVLLTITTAPTGGALTGAIAADSRIAVLSLETRETRVILPRGSSPRYSPTGHIVYALQGNLWAVRFDPSRLETAGESFPVQEGVLTKPTGAANFGLSKNGSLIYMPDVAATRSLRTMVWVDRDGHEAQLNAPPAPYESPRISPDGRYVAVEVQEPENRDVIIYDLERDTSTRLTLDPGVDGYPIWTPAGRR